jgi:predicted TIM-barrel fold metal-dependent hydrolase
MPTKLVPRNNEHARAPRAAAAPLSVEADRAQWRARTREPILEPQLPIVDPHHHLWVRPGERYLLEDYLADAQSGHDIRATVFVECGAFHRQGATSLMAPLGEVEFANGIAAMAASGAFGATRVCAGIVGTADLTVGADAARVLDAQLAAAKDRFRGIRLITKWDADEALNNGRYVIPRGLLEDADFRAGFATLGPRGLSFDAMVYHPQLPELAALAHAFPETTIVLDHIGGPLAGTPSYAGRGDEATAHWRGGMRELARCSNVYVKLGGLGMPYLGFGFEQRTVPAGSEELAAAWAPYFAQCIETFGPERCMFESNFPPDRASVDFPILWNAFKRFAARYSVQEKAALFSGTAAKAYRLALDG